jgi:hypothetical protein
MLKKAILFANSLDMLVFVTAGISIVDYSPIVKYPAAIIWCYFLDFLFRNATFFHSAFASLNIFAP